MITKIRVACKALWHDKKGSAPIWMFACMAAVLSVALVILETGIVYTNYTRIETAVQSSVECAVETSMLDEYRKDGINMMDANAAKTSFISFLGTRLNLQDIGGGVYKISGNDTVTIKIESVDAVAGGYPVSTDSPTLSVKGTISFNPILKSDLTKNLSLAKFPLNITSTNFRTDGK